MIPGSNLTYTFRCFVFPFVFFLTLRQFEIIRVEDENSYKKRNRLMQNKARFPVTKYRYGYCTKLQECGSKANVPYHASPGSYSACQHGAQYERRFSAACGLLLEKLRRRGGESWAYEDGNTGRQNIRGAIRATFSDTQI